MAPIRTLIEGLENHVPVLAASNYALSGLASVKSLITRVTIKYGIVVFLLTFTFIIAPRFWLKIFYGDDLSQYAYLVYWFGFINLLFYISYPFQVILRTLNTTRPIFLANISMAIFSVCSAYYLVSVFRETGAALGIAFTRAIMVAILLYSTTYTFKRYVIPK